MLRTCLAIAICLAAVPAAHAQPVSGTYGSLHIVVTDDRLAGVYDQRIGERATETICIFLLEGRLGESEIAVDVRLPGVSETTRGVLSAGEPSRIGIRLEEPMPGCAMAAGPLAREGEVLTLDEARPEWIAVGIVTADGERFRATPTADVQPDDKVLSAYDAVAILARHKDSFHVESLGGSEANTGWASRGSVAVAPASEQ